MESDGDHFLAYYLTQTDEAAVSFKASRLTAPNSSNSDPLAFLDDEKADPDADGDAGATAFHFLRDYETVKIEQEVPNEFLLVLDDGGEVRRRKGAYYKNIERKMILKKKRVNVRFPSLQLICYTLTQRPQ